MSSAQWYLGIDIGTSASAAAVWFDGRVDVLEIAGANRVPSIAMRRDGSLIVGQIARRLSGADPGAVVTNPKRRVGSSTPLVLDGQPVTIDEVLTALIAVFVDEGARRFGGAPPSGVAVTCPASWSTAQRKVLHAAAAVAAPEAKIGLISEPQAAAVYYAHERPMKPGSHVAVYDLGGGTFDTAVLRSGTDGGFALVGLPGGDDDIGGDEFTRLVYDLILTQVRARAPQWLEKALTAGDATALRDLRALQDLAAEIKESLSDLDTVTEYVRGADVEVTLTRTEYEALIADDLRRSVATLDRTLQAAGVTSDELSGVYLTGAASRTPLVGEMLRARFGTTVQTWGNPKLAVAVGAAHTTHLWSLGIDPTATEAPSAAGPTGASTGATAGSDPRSSADGGEQVPPRSAGAPSGPAAAAGRDRSTGVPADEAAPAASLAQIVGQRLLAILCLGVVVAQWVGVWRWLADEHYMDHSYGWLTWEVFGILVVVVLAGADIVGALLLFTARHRLLGVRLVAPALTQITFFPVWYFFLPWNLLLMVAGLFCLLVVNGPLNRRRATWRIDRPVVDGICLALLAMVIAVVAAFVSEQTVWIPYDGYVPGLILNAVGLFLVYGAPILEHEARLGRRSRLTTVSLCCAHFIVLPYLLLVTGKGLRDYVMYSANRATIALIIALVSVVVGLIAVAVGTRARTVPAVRAGSGTA